MQTTILARNIWDSFQTASGCRSFGVFHSASWMDFAVQTTSHSADASIAFSNGEEASVLVPLVRIGTPWPRRLYSHADGHYGGLICNGKPTNSFLADIEKHLYYECAPLAITPDPLIPNPPFGNEAQWEKEQECTHVLALSNTYEDWFTQACESKCRTHIRFSRKQGVIVCVDKTPENCARYYSLYLSSAQRWGKASVLPLSYFERLLGLESAALYLALKDNEPIAGTITLECDRYTFSYRAVFNKDYAKYCATYLILDTIINESFKGKKEFLNLGASPNLPQIQRFKESFGATPLFYTTYRSHTWKTRAVSTIKRCFGAARNRLCRLRSNGVSNQKGTLQAQ